MNTSTTDTTPTPRTDEACEAMGLKAFVVPVETSRQLERELSEKTKEVARLRKVMREYIDFMDENLGTTADWPMEASFDDGDVCQRHCDLLNAMKREVKPEDIN